MPARGPRRAVVGKVGQGGRKSPPERGSKKVSERTKVGLDRARALGAAIGRPDGYERWAPRLMEMKEARYSQGAMSRKTGLTYNTVKSYLRRALEAREADLARLALRISAPPLAEKVP